MDETLEEKKKGYNEVIILMAEDDDGHAELVADHLERSGVKIR